MIKKFGIIGNPIKHSLSPLLHNYWFKKYNINADYSIINVKNENVVSKVREITGGKGVDYVVECAGAPSGINEAAQMVNRGGKICLAAFPSGMAEVDIAHVVRNNIYLYGIRGEGKTATHRAEAFMRQKRFDATLIHTHTFKMNDLEEALRYAKDRVEDAIKVVVKNEHVSQGELAAE